MSTAATRRRSVLKLARACQWHETHSRHVARLCMMLFDDLHRLHRRNARVRELLETAALLHDIGWHISGKKHHKHSMKLILEAKLDGFAREDVQIIANIARYHRRAIPKGRHEAYSSLTANAQKIVDLGAALLRIGDGLDRTHTSAVRSLAVRVGAQRVRCIVEGEAEMNKEIKAARRKSDLFEKVFQRDMQFG